jgi:hypothetical protein
MTKDERIKLLERLALAALNLLYVKGELGAYTHMCYMSGRTEEACEKMEEDAKAILAKKENK